MVDESGLSDDIADRLVDYARNAPVGIRFHHHGDVFRGVMSGVNSNKLQLLITPSILRLAG